MASPSRSIAVFRQEAHRRPRRGLARHALGAELGSLMPSGMLSHIEALIAALLGDGGGSVHPVLGSCSRSLTIRFAERLAEERHLVGPRLDPGDRGQHAASAQADRRPARPRQLACANASAMSAVQRPRHQQSRLSPFGHSRHGAFETTHSGRRSTIASVSGNILRSVGHRHRPAAVSRIGVTLVMLDRPRQRPRSSCSMKVRMPDSSSAKCIPADRLHPPGSGPVAPRAARSRCQSTWANSFNEGSGPFSPDLPRAASICRAARPASRRCCANQRWG